MAALQSLLDGYSQRLAKLSTKDKENRLRSEAKADQAAFTRLCRLIRNKYQKWYVHYMYKGIKYEPIYYSSVLSCYIIATQISGCITSFAHCSECRTELAGIVSTLQGGQTQNYPTATALLSSGFPIQFPWYANISSNGQPF
jgi:hypothetical protein